MAKKKKEVTEPIAEVVEAPVEEVEAVEIATPDEVAVAPIVAEEKVEEKVDNSDQFIFTQLKNINRMPNQAKAKRLAERVLRNKKG